MRGPGPDGFQRWWRGFAIGLGLLGFAGFIWTAGLWNQQLDTLPRSSYPAGGGIYPRNIHGIIVYQTRAERDHLDEVQDIAMGTVVFSVLLSVFYNRKWGPEPQL